MSLSSPPPSIPQEHESDFSVNFSDPWTISAVILLGLLSSAAIYRIYYTIFNKNSVGNTNTTFVEKVVVDDKKIKTHHSTRAQMRG